MDINKIASEISKLPEHLRNLAISSLIKTSMTLKKADEEFLQNNKGAINEGNGLHQKTHGNSLMGNFLDGRHTQQTQAYEERYKMILERADDFVVDMNGNVREKTNVEKKKRQRLLENMGDNSDLSYPYERHFTPQKICINDLEVAGGANPIYDYTTTIQRTHPVLHRTEDVLENVIIRTINDTEKIIELYCNNAKPHLIENDMNNIVGFCFSEPTYRGDETYFYKKTQFLTKKLWNNQILLKFKANFMQTITTTHKK